VPARTVLLVDSHEDSRAIYTAIFEHHGWRVLAAACPEEALRLAAEHAPDLVVMEFAPPRTRSLEALRALRRERPATAPFVALSTTLGDADRDLLLAEGVSAYLQKPCPPLTLLAEARRLLEREGGGPRSADLGNGR
jgi:CheY-like chemotaxis protein